CSLHLLAGSRHPLPLGTVDQMVSPLPSTVSPQRSAARPFVLTPLRCRLRTRIGFAAYFSTDFNHDHVVAESRDTYEARWRLVDPELSELHHSTYRIAFDPCDAPRDAFLDAGLGWQRCRSDAADPTRFGVSPDPEEDARCTCLISHTLVQDLAAQNKA